MFQTIVYHLIDEPKQSISWQEKRMFVSLENFEQHLDYLRANGYDFLSLKQAEDRLNNNCTQNKKEILITFDDGYCNTVDVVIPILQKKRIPAVMSVCGSYLFPETRINIEMHADKNFADVSKIKQWIACGNSILAHTYSHYKLTHLSAKDCIYEIEKDYELLKKVFGTAPQGIAYPYGSVNEQVIAIAQKFYQYGFATDMGCKTSWKNRYRIKRICAENNCSAKELFEKVSKDED